MMSCTTVKTTDNGVIDLMRGFTFPLPPVDVEALAQGTGHKTALLPFNLNIHGQSIWLLIGRVQLQ